MTSNYWVLNFSRNCDYYSLVNENYNLKDCQKVFFGLFDKTTGKFTRKSTGVIKDCNRVLNSIISLDYSKIYYWVANINTLNMVEIPIENGLPNFDKQTIVHSLRHVTFIVPCVFYGLDNKIYVMDFSARRLSSIETDEFGNTICNTLVSDINTSKYSPLHFVSSWFSDNPCETYFTCQNNCITNEVKFIINNYSNVKKVVWNFGDNSPKSDVLTPIHKYSTPGKYSVKLEIYYDDNNVKTYNKNIEIKSNFVKPKIISE